MVEAMLLSGCQGGIHNGLRLESTGRACPGGRHGPGFSARARDWWAALYRDGVRLRVTDDGKHWSLIDLPQEAGAPTDVRRFRGQLVVLTEDGLYRIDNNEVKWVASVNDKKSPFELRDSLCAAPLSVFENELYADGQRDGSLYRLVIDS